MKTPEEIAHRLRGPWDIVTDGMLTRIAAAIAAERERMDSTLEVWKHKVALLTDERNRLRADLAEALQQIIDIDRVQKKEVVSVDASGATHSVTWVDGRCAKIARALLERLRTAAQEDRDAVHG